MIKQGALRGGADNADSEVEKKAEKKRQTRLSRSYGSQFYTLSPDPGPSNYKLDSLPLTVTHTQTQTHTHTHTHTHTQCQCSGSNGSRSRSPRARVPIWRFRSHCAYGAAERTQEHYRYNLLRLSGAHSP